MCGKFLEKVIRKKGVKDKKSEPMFKYTFMEAPPFIFKVWKHVFIIYKNNSLFVQIIKRKNKHG